MTVKEFPLIESSTFIHYQRIIIVKSKSITKTSKVLLLFVNLYSKLNNICYVKYVLLLSLREYQSMSAIDFEEFLYK